MILEYLKSIRRWRDAGFPEGQPYHYESGIFGMGNIRIFVFSIGGTLRDAHELQEELNSLGFYEGCYIFPEWSYSRI